MYLLPMIFSLLNIFSMSTVWPLAAPLGMNQTDPAIVDGADAYLKAVLACDLPAISAMFQDGARLMPPNQALLQGNRAIEGFYARLCHGPAKLTAFRFNHIEAKMAGEVAYDVGTYKMLITLGLGQTVEDNGKYSVILKRTGDGWKIAYLIFNSDLPPQQPGTNVPRG